MKIKGHTDIILTDIKTGKREVYSDDNMITDAITQYFRNCGLMNLPNVDRDQLVEDLLGGIMAFSEPITEDATKVTLPAGNTMIANGSYDVDNDGTPEELGSYSNNESGWQQDGSFIQTYDYSASQGIGTISCVCLTGKDMGYVGLGNARSKESHSTKREISNLKGSPFSYTIPEGRTCHVSLSDSSLYTVDLSDLENGNIIIRKYRIPASKINLKGTTTSLVKLSETTISAPANMVSARDYLYARDTYSVLEVWNCLPPGSSATWGNGHTQYLWDIDPVAGTVTENVLVNTSGDTLYELFNPFFTGGKIVWVNGYIYRSSYYSVDATNIYQLDRSTGVITKVENQYGEVGSAGNSWHGAANAAGWNICYADNDGVLICGRDGLVLEYDTSEADVRITNGKNLHVIGDYNTEYAPTDSPLIGVGYNNGILSLYRKQNYIASINNLATPVTKDATKTMKIVYTIRF